MRKRWFTYGVLAMCTALLLTAGIGAAKIVPTKKGDNGSPTTGQIGICHHTEIGRAHV